MKKSLAIDKMYKLDTVIKILIRIVSVVMVYFIFYMIRSHYAYLPLTTYRVIVWTGIGILCNVGLWNITTRFAKKWKIISIVLYLPTILISTGAAPGNDVVYLLISIAILIKYFPWRKD